MPTTPKKVVSFLNGQCSACRVQELKKEINWKEREEELLDLLAKYRSTDGSPDVLVPGSGGKDSFYAAHVLKYKYNMHPLTVTWRPHIYTDWGRRNFDAWLETGLPNILYSPNPHIHRLLSRLALENLFHPFQTFGLGQFNYPPRAALIHNIKLVFYGEDAAEYGADASSYFSYKGQGASNLDFAIDENEYENLYLGGMQIREIIERFGIKVGELLNYLPISSYDLSRSNILVARLGYFLKWRPQHNYYYATSNSNFRAAPERTSGTYTKFNSIDDKLDDLFYWTGYIKMGLGRATFDACQDIYNNEISRDEGIALVKKYDGEYPTRFEEEVLNYLEANMPFQGLDYFKTRKLDRQDLFNLADKFRHSHIWQRDHQDQWKLSYDIGEQQYNSTWQG